MVNVLKNMFRVNDGGLGSTITKEEFMTAKKAANILEFKQGLQTNSESTVLSKEIAYL
jgi:hypothetical protein